MGKSLYEWEIYFEQLSLGFLTQLINALTKVKEAEMIWDEYGWTGLGILLELAKEVEERRVTEARDV